MIYFTNPREQNKKIKNKIITSFKKTINSQTYILGKEVKIFEKNFSKYIGTKYAAGVANGTDALELALMLKNIGKGDEVITTSHTASATISAITSVGAKPIFIDIDDNYLMDITQLRGKISNKTRAIIAVHLYGNPLNIVKIKKIINKKIYLIEDCSQAHGAKLNGNRVGSLGDLGCFSLYPTKNLGAIGDAGIITLNSLKDYNKLIKLRQYGWNKRRVSVLQGKNSRLDAIQASILNIKLKKLDQDNRKRNKIAEMYIRAFKNLPIVLPKIQKETWHVFHLFVIRLKERNKLKKYLLENKIFTGIHYETPNHLHGYFKKIALAKNLKKTENFSKNILSLPIYPELSQKKVKYIINTTKRFFKK